MMIRPDLIIKMFTCLQAQALYDQAKDLESYPSCDQVGARAKFTEAAEKGFALAQYELGNYAYYGRGGYSGNDADEAEALKFWTLAADQDNLDAASSIGKIYFYGRNWLPQDLAKAKAVLQKGFDALHNDSVYFYQNIFKVSSTVIKSRGDGRRNENRSNHQGCKNRPVINHGGADAVFLSNQKRHKGKEYTPCRYENRIHKRA